MSQKENVIEINGKRYDALSGKLLGDTSSITANAPTSHLPVGHSLDGFIGKKPVNLAKATAAASPIVAQKLPAAPVPSGKLRQFSDITRAPQANNVQHHKVTGSKTLMRHAVNKPKPSLKRHTKVQQRTDVLVKQPSITVKPKLSSYTIDPRRTQHAKQVPRHPDANRYAAPRPALVASTANATSTPAAAVAVPAPRPVQRTSAPSQPAIAPKKPADIFEQALARANNHIESPTVRRHTKRRRGFLGGRALSFGAASLAVVLVVGFFAWQQKASLTMHYAAAKSGVSASLPAYKPAGFSAGKFSYSPGLVAVNFNNPKTGDSFALVEKSTTWDSQALLDGFVASKSRTYQTIDAAGRTIYTYGTNATWVDNGVWYQVNGHGSLNTNQLVQLALSM
ncbi:hypothetical protein BH09PAT4_BH09PAT4_04500 [soil metagenome]